MQWVTIRAAFPLRRRVKEGCKSRHPRPAKKARSSAENQVDAGNQNLSYTLPRPADFCNPSPLIAQTTHLGSNAELYLSQPLKAALRGHTAEFQPPTWMPLRPRIIASQRVTSTRLLKRSPIDTIIRWVRGAGNSPVSGPNLETVDNHLSLDSVTYHGHLIVR